MIGVGTMGRRHARVLSSLPHLFSLVGVYDADPGAARDVAGDYGITAYASEAACLGATEVVVIASPIEAHAAAARGAIERGIDVLVEKPLTASVADAFALVKTATRCGAHLYVGHSERFNPVVLALGLLVRPRDVRSITIRRATSSTHADGLRAGEARRPRSREHGVLLSLGVHDVDLVAHLTGALPELRAVSGVVRPEGEARAELALVAGSATAHLLLDRDAARRERTIELTTAREVYEGDLLAPRLVRTTRGGGPGVEVDLARIEPLAGQARALAAALDGIRPARLATGADGARALAVAVQARDWLKDGCRPDRQVG